MFNLKGLATKIPEGYKFYKMLLFSLYKVTFFSGENQEKRLNMIFFIGRSFIRGVVASFIKK